MLHGQWDHYDGKLRRLRLVNADRIRQRDFVQFPVIVFHQSVIEANRNLLLNWINPLHDPDVAVEHVLVVVVFGLDNLVSG